MDDYEIKRQTKIERCKALSGKHSVQANQDFDHAHKMGSIIPFGQPILVGHHSENKDRRFRDRIQRTAERGFKHQKKSAYTDFLSKIYSFEKSVNIFMT